MSKITPELIQAFNNLIEADKYSDSIVIKIDALTLEAERLAPNKRRGMRVEIPIKALTAAYKKCGWDVLHSDLPVVDFLLYRPSHESPGSEWVQGFYCALAVVADVHGSCGGALEEAFKTGGDIKGATLPDRITLAMAGLYQGFLPDPDAFE